jgi:hypothetical protein
MGYDREMHIFYGALAPKEPLKLDLKGISVEELSDQDTNESYVFYILDETWRIYQMGKFYVNPAEQEEDHVETPFIPEPARLLEFQKACGCPVKFYAVRTSG